MSGKIKIVCKNCGKEFEDYMSNHRQFCCRDCKNEYFKKQYDDYKIKKCIGCGKEFRPRENRVCFCSFECYSQHQKRNSYSRNTRKCEWCGKLYYPQRRDQRYCSKRCGYDWYSEYKKTEDQRKIQANIVLNLLNDGKTKRSFTKPHVIIDDLLDSMDIAHIDEYNIEYYSIDIYLPNRNLMIEIMGDFWHTNPVSKFKEPKNDVQKNRIPKDKAKHTYVKNQYGIEILYLWESDIYNYLDVCRELILLYINNNGVLDDYNSFNYLMYDDKLELCEIIVQPLFLMQDMA